MITPSIERSVERRWVVLSVLCLSLLLATMANMGLNVALPSIGRDMNASFDSMQWIVDSYALLFAGLLLPFGALGDRFGRKGALQLGLVLFSVSAFVASFSTETWQLITLRSVMGVGAALIMPGTLSILVTVFPPAERQKAIAIWAAVAGGGVALSITASGLLLGHFWWGSIFLTASAVAVVALVAGAFLLPTSRHLESRIDPIGVVLSIVAIGGLVAGLIQGPVHGWGSREVVGLFVASALGIAGFIMWERRRENPMLDVRFFRDPRFSVGSISIVTAYLSLFGLYFLLTQYLQMVRGDSPIEAGLLALPAGLAQMIAANISRPFVTRHGYRPVLFSGLASSAVGLLVMSRLGQSTPIVVCELGLLMVGTGIGFTMPPATGALLAAIPPHKMGVGSAINDVTREIGGAVGIALFGSIVAVKFRSAITPHLDVLSAGDRGDARRGLADALAAAHDTGSTELAGQAKHAFLHGFQVALSWGAGLVAVLAVAVFRYMPSGLRPPATVTAKPVTAPGVGNG